jgi:predicted transcriptional regulator
MPAEKLSISLPEGLAAHIDALAASDGVSRSYLIQEAAAQYVASREGAARDQARRAAVGSAIAGFDSVAAVWGQDEKPGVEYLADVRGEDSATPAAPSRDTNGD